MVGVVGGGGVVSASGGRVDQGQRLWAAPVLLPAVEAAGITALFVPWYDVPVLESEFWDKVQWRSWEGCKAPVGDWAAPVLVVIVIADSKTATNRV